MMRKSRVTPGMWRLLSAATLSLASAGIFGLVTNPVRVTASAGSGGQSDSANRVIDLQLINESRGWVLTPDDLGMTEDGGKSWRDITPLGVRAESISDVFFLDQARGWLIGSTDVTDAVNRPQVLFATKDGGNTWLPTALPEVPEVYGQGAPLQIDFVDDLTGWVMVPVPTSSNFSQGRLFRTINGGLTWQELEIPIGDEINFITPTDGWTAGGAAGDELYVTRDGGATWEASQVELPPPFHQGRPAYDIPTFHDATRGVLPVTVTGPRDIAASAFYVTDDGGRTWALGGKVHPNPKAIATGVSILADPVTPDIWIEIDPQRGSVVVSKQAGSQKQELAASGLGEGAFVLDFASARIGWAASASEECPDKTNCTLTSSLLTTNDQGQTWQELTPP